MIKIVMMAVMVLVNLGLVHAEDMRNVEFFQRIVSNREGLLFEGVTWMKDGLVRVEYDAGPETYTSIIIRDKVYNYSSASSTGVIVTKMEPRFGFGPEVLQSPSRLQAFLETVKATKKGTETYEDRPCDIYVYEYDEGKIHVKNTLWVWTEGSFPLKTEMTMDNDIVTIFYDKVHLGAAIDDQKFVVPQNIRFYNE